MDVLSDVLRVVRLTSAVFFTARFSSPWSIESPPPDQLARSLRLRAESIALFHVLVEGQCWISVEGHAAARPPGLIVNGASRTWHARSESLVPDWRNGLPS